jgi:hypothetical protein
MKRYKRFEETIKSILAKNGDILTIGDFCKIIIPRHKIHPGLPTNYIIKITKIINKNLVEGVVNTGSFAGYSEKGTPVEKVNV